MKARNKFLIGAGIVLSTSGSLMWSSIRDTNTYFFRSPAELNAKIRGDSSWAGRKVQLLAPVVPGSIVRAPDGRQYAFRGAVAGDTIAIVYKGIAPDTFTDSVDVVVEGSFDAAGTFQATTLVTKCASRYENAPGYPGAPSGSHPAGIPKKP